MGLLFAMVVLNRKLTRPYAYTSLPKKTVKRNCIGPLKRATVSTA